MNKDNHHAYKYFFLQHNKTYLVGLGGGYEIPRWLGDNKLPDWLFVGPGTSNVLLL